MRLLPLALDKVPKLNPDPVAAPEANGVEKFVDVEEGVDPNNELEVDEGAKSEVCGEVPAPNHGFAGVEETGVENIEDDEEAITGVLKVDVCGAVDVGGRAEVGGSPVG